MAGIAFNLPLCKIKAIWGFPSLAQHGVIYWTLSELRGIQNSGQGKSSFTKAGLSPQGPGQLRTALLCHFAAAAGRGEITLLTSP